MDEKEDVRETRKVRANSDPNHNCCYKPDVIVVFRKTRISRETQKVEKIAKCPNCGMVKKKMDEYKERYGK